MSNRKVVYAKLHSPVFVPGLGSLKDTLPPDNKTLVDLVMSKEADGNLRLTWYDPRFNKNRCAEVGAASVLCIAYEDETPAPKPVAVTQVPAVGSGTIVVKS